MKVKEGIEEVFFIKTESIDFFGALVMVKDGTNAVHGRVRFHDGKGLYFHIPAGDRLILRNELNSACRDIAEFYHVDVFHKKFQGVIGYDEFTALLDNSGQMMS